MKRLIIDVREPFEYATGHVEGAINIPPEKLMSSAALPINTLLDTQLIVYCRTGSRSSVAMHLLKEQGYTNIINGINKDQVEAKLKKGEYEI